MHLKITTVGFVVLMSIIMSCTHNSSATKGDTVTTVDSILESIPEFSGIVTYTAKAESPDTLRVKTFYEFAPNVIELFYSKTKFKMIEHGGLSSGNILIDTELKKGWQIYPEDSEIYEGHYSDLGLADENVKANLPDHFAPATEETNEQEVISGYTCKKIKIIRSGMIPQGNDATIWVTDAFKFPSSRYDIETEANRVTVPLPILIGYTHGAVLKMEIISKDFKVTYTAVVKPQILPDSLFLLPAHYTFQ